VAVEISSEALEHVKWFERKTAHFLVDEIERILSGDPVTETKNNKILRTNPFAQRQLSLRGRYRVLFNLDHLARVVNVVAVGEKKGAALFVRGEEFRAHHESGFTEQS